MTGSEHTPGVLRALVLAAGASRRLGSPKALVDLGGRPALARVVETLVAAGVLATNEAGVIVVGAHVEALAAAVDPAPLRWVRNPDPDAGRTGSIAAGLAALPDDSRVLLWPVDRPAASAATVRALAEASAAAPGAFVVPESGGRRGHPVVLPPVLRAPIAAAPPDASLRDLVRASGVARIVVPVDDSPIHFDLDTPTRVAKVQRWWGERRGG